jgi:hypothetical protein
MEQTAPSSVGLTKFIDRWIYFFMAVLFFTVVLVGFIPDSLIKIEAVQAGTRAPFSMILHVHAVLMGSWMMLLLAQTWLMATGRPGAHKQLGLLSFILAPAIIVAGFILVPTNYVPLWHATQAAPAELGDRLVFVTNIILLQLRIGFLFGFLICTALLVRKSDSDTHKRLMILAIAAALPAATDRITWLPHAFPESPLTADIYPLLLILPLFLWDLFRRRAVPRAYLIWALAYVPLTIAVHMLWGSQWWLTNAPKIMGLG